MCFIGVPYNRPQSGKSGLTLWNPVLFKVYMLVGAQQTFSVQGIHLI